MINSLLALVDTQDFRGLFVEALGWGNPDQQPQHVTIDDQQYTLTQVAGYKGLRIWHCAALPPRPIQRRIDLVLGATSTERLLIFTGPDRQDWRWPRRRQLGAANAKLLVHEHLIGQPNPGLIRRLHAIELDLDADLSLVALLERMREAFDAESETASIQASRLMRSLYSDLEVAGVGEHEATLVLARLLFLFFGDDADMWQPNLFHYYVRDNTTAGSLHEDLGDLFAILDTPEDRRELIGGSPFATFRYINGDLYGEPVAIPPLTEKFRDGVLEACEFDWSIISPAIFGSMFQTVKSKEARRGGGEHYTSEENILKTIRPLFLDEYAARLEAAWSDKGQLTKLHKDLGELRLLDPACGCGNFLIVAYRELRALELEILKRRRDLDLLDGRHTGSADRTQLTLDITADIKVTLDHFFGIEIEEWPAYIAETAMLLVDHLANQRMAQEFGEAPDRLPIVIAPTIKHNNALYGKWADLVEPSSDVIVFGNPPFAGRGTRTDDQTRDAKFVWGSQYNINLDHVTCWYLRAVRYFGDYNGRWAFVSTNSICQGEPTATLWKPILNARWRCRFAHRSFQWNSEAPGKAVVHVSIVGFDRGISSPKPKLWTYPLGGKGIPTQVEAARINPYLVDGPNVLVQKRQKPLHHSLPEVAFGSMPNDGGHLLIGPAELDNVMADPVAAKYVRPFIGAKQLLYNLPRWCLWLVELDERDVSLSPVLRSRIDATREHRLNSDSPTTSTKMHPPHLFGQIAQPNTEYLAIPGHVGEHRRFFTVARYSADVICGNANFLAPDPHGYALGIVSSSMFMAWMRTIGGRIKSDPRFSKTFTYNTFPLPAANTGQRESIIAASANIIAVRSCHPGVSLAALYDPADMPRDLLAAHLTLDTVIDQMFGFASFESEFDRQKTLFRNYAKLTKQEALL